MNVSPLVQAVDEVARELVGALKDAPGTLRLRDRGIVRYVGRGIAVVDGLAGVGSEELVHFEGGALGLAFNLDPDSVGIVLLDDADRVETGFVAARDGARRGNPGRAKSCSAGWLTRWGGRLTAGVRPGTSLASTSSSRQRPSWTAPQSRCRCRPA